MEPTIVDLVDGRGSEFGVKTISTLASCPVTDHVTTQQELDRCGANTCGIIEEKESKIYILATSTWRK